MKKEKEKKYKEVVINTCYGGFGLSDEAYEELIKLGVPTRKYSPELKDEKVIFDRKLTPKGESVLNDVLYWDRQGKSKLAQRYWDAWIQYDRENPLLIQVIKKLGTKANGPYSDLKIVKIPAYIDYVIEEYDGVEHIAESHRVWD